MSKMKISFSICIAFVVSVFLFLLNPLSIYVENIDFVAFNLIDVLPLWILFSIIGFLLFALLITLISKRLKYFPHLLTAFSVCLWIQGNFIKYDLGKLDGHQILWTELLKNLWIEILVWLAVFALFICFREKIGKHYKVILTLLLLLYSLPTLFLLKTNSQNIPIKTYLDTSKEFEYSTQNVIIIILDTFKSGVFEEVLEKYSGYDETFKDFTFFEDAIGGYTTTMPSIPLILTGEYYLNGMPYNDYLSLVEETTISSQLKQNGYSIESYPYVPFFSSLYDNQTKVMPSDEKLITAVEQIIVSGVRYSPLLLKPFFVARFYAGIEPVHNDLVAFNSRVDEVVVVTDKPLFKLIHLSGVHAPIQLDSSLNWNEAGYLEQASGSLLLVKNLLAELKTAGVYDNSLIIVMGDHGDGLPVGSSTFPLASFSHPLLLIKRIGQQSEHMIISDSAVTLGDLPKTISEETNIEYDYSGYAIFEEIPADRVRKYYYHTWDSTVWISKHLPTLYEFEISGNANLASSWKYLGKFQAGSFDNAEYEEDIDMIKSLFEE